MWAVESEKASADISSDVIYYMMAKKFGFTPEKVDAMDAERVKTFLYLDAKVEEKESRELKTNKGRNQW